MKQQNEKETHILITTIGSTQNHLKPEYYAARDAYDEIRFCAGISTTEAGAKYILSRYGVDQIVVLGTADAEGRTPDTQPRQLSDYALGSLQADQGRLSEYDYFCYRLSQYLQHIDIEAEDLLYHHGEERRRELADLMNRSIPGGPDGRFYRCATEEAGYQQFCSVAEGLADEQEIWCLKHMMYQRMNPVYKLNALRKNNCVVVRYVPMVHTPEGGISMDSLMRLVYAMAERSMGTLNIHIDLRGMDKVDSYTMWSMFAMVNSAYPKFRVQSVIHTRTAENSFTHTIDDEIGRYAMDTLLSGMLSFIKYGKVELLEEYCAANSVTNERMGQMLRAMKYVDAGVSLCNMSDLLYGMQALNLLFRRLNDEEEGDGGKDPLCSMLMRCIQADYGLLLQDDEILIPRLIHWALRKHFYQQALTMIEALVPGDMVKRGILYYARTREDVQDVLARWNVLFWNETPKLRYVFLEPDHYFIKNYGRAFINNHQPRERVVRDLARALIDQQKNARPEICRTYSDLGDDKLLYELLVSYYVIGMVRNQVSHASRQENALDEQEEMSENESFKLVQKSIARFLRIYRSACWKTLNHRKEGKTVGNPIIIEPETLRGYTFSHRLMLLEQTQADLRVENTYSCNFNGQSMLITVNLFRPEICTTLEDVERDNQSILNDLADRNGLMGDLSEESGELEEFEEEQSEVSDDIDAAQESQT